MTTPTPQIVTLTHPSTGAQARILVSQGCNCFDLHLPARERLHSVLWAHPNFASGQERPSGSGIPLLFPFPGRIARGNFSWNGRTYQLPINDRLGNAIHGFVYDRPWRMVKQSDTMLTAEFQASVDDPQLLELWPADFRIVATYTLTEAALQMDYSWDNPGDAPLPCGLGTHPYFRLPLGGDQPPACEISLPVTRQWELQNLIPTGKQLDLPSFLGPQPTRYESITADHALTGLIYRDQRATATIHDPIGGTKLTIDFSQPFRECVVYTPPHREAICIEPLTSVPCAIQLQGQAIDTGLMVLQPGEQRTASVRCALAAE
ncbi:MAG: aldose 1-epimerase [Planctomycetota bacterium]